MEIKCCPFCGSTKIDYSVKTTTIQFETRFHVCMYCKTCNTYGPRVLTDGLHKNNRSAVVKDTSLKEKAIELWNRRS